MQYLIREDFLPGVEKKLNAIAKKCTALNNPFEIEYGEPVFQECTPPAPATKKITVKFIPVTVSGIAEVNGFNFVGTLEHKDGGNVIRQISDFSIPDKFKSCPPFCEHCRKSRRRNDTYLIRNAEGHVKQVGKSCLKLYTGGLDSEAVTRWLDGVAFLEVYAQNNDLSNYNQAYIETEEFLRIAVELTRIRGFSPVRNEDGFINPDATVSRALMHYSPRFRFKGEEKKLADDKALGFAPEAVDLPPLLTWLENQLDTSDYIHNLKILVNQPYIERRDTGLVASLPRAYQKSVTQTAARATAQKSEYIGAVGEKIEIAAFGYKILTSYETEYGSTFVVSFADSNGNICIWKTANPFEDLTDGTLVKGTIKNLNEYKGVKQTVLTRCKIVK